MNHNLINDYIATMEVQLSHMLGKKVTVRIDVEEWKQGDIGNIVSIVSDTLGVSLADMIMKNRKPAISEARQLCWLLLQSKCPMSLNAIGKYFGGRDHTTILYGIQHIQNLLDAGDEIVTSKYKKIQSALKKKINESE